LKGEIVPDIWTAHPEIVRSLLREGGLTCGSQPRILKGRDPEWTCIVDGKTISGDIYIHSMDTTLGIGTTSLVAASIAFLRAVVATCQTLVIVRLRRRSKPR
jgi:hypothetical protein